jgi:hypothetical protein
MVKNLLLAFTLVCIIVLIVFSIELIVVNRKTGDNKTNGPSVSGNASDGTEKPTDKPPADGGSTATGNNPNQSTGPSTPPTGKPYTMRISSRDMIALHAEEELFEYAQMSDRYVFTYTDGETAMLEVRPIHIPLGAAKRAETILDSYLGGNEPQLGGAGPIKDSSLSGEYVSGVKDGETSEAWIYTMQDDPDNDFIDMGVAFIISYSNNEQKNALYDVLDTLTLISS